MSETPAADDSNVGRIVADKYRIDAVVGTGGSGTVYRASHLILARNIALKVLNPNLVANPTAKARFRREARAASKLDHPNSVQVFDYGIEPDGLTYLAMELLDGRELFKVIYDDWPVGSERTVKIMSQVLSVLAAAHEAGIVHRDLKPENIMLVKRAGEDGRLAEVVKVADFGIAKTFTGPMSEDSINLTRDGTVHGTPEYMSPEQARGEEIDGRTDLYACGIILYEMMVGALPFVGESAFEVILKQLSDPVTPPSARRSDVDRRIEPVVMRALNKDRALRYASAREMREALLGALALPLPANFEPAAPQNPESRSTVTTIAGPVAPPSNVRGPLPSEPAMLLTRRRDDVPGEETDDAHAASANVAPGPGILSATLDEYIDVQRPATRRSTLPLALAAIGVIALIAVAAITLNRRASSVDGTVTPTNVAAIAGSTGGTAAPAAFADSETAVVAPYNGAEPLVRNPTARTPHVAAPVAPANSHPVRPVHAGSPRAHRPRHGSAARSAP